ncbi:MAG: hypothetical protein QM660_10605 [Dysgonomonas sp.]
MNELFEVIDPASEALKNTPEEEAFRLANYIQPIEANTFRKPPEIIQVDIVTYTLPDLIKLAHFVNSELKQLNIIAAALDYSNDYRTKPIDSDNISEFIFDAKGVMLFLEWCKPKEKDLFNQ